MVLASREFIAVPDDRKRQIVFKWPDVRIRKYSKAIVDADEVALFVNTGQVIGTMGPGRHQLDADELPFLGTLVDLATGGNAYRAELYFVGTREYPGFTFGGRIDDVQDPQTGLIVTLRVFGDYSLQVHDPALLVTNLVGTVDVTDNERIARWVSDQLLKVMRTEVTTQVTRNGWQVLGLSVHTPELEKAVIASANNELATYGVSLVRMGNFDINLPEEDEAQLKGLAKDTAYSRLAGGFNRYAAGEMAIEAGQGVARSGGDAGILLATGLGLPGQAAVSGGRSVPGETGPVPPPAPGFAGGGKGFAAGMARAGEAEAGDGEGEAGKGEAGAREAGNRDVSNWEAAKGEAGAVDAATVEGSDGEASAVEAATVEGSEASERKAGDTGVTPAAGHCAACGSDNPPGARFCANCGRSLVQQIIHCQACGAVLTPGQRFCVSCGTAAPASST